MENKTQNRGQDDRSDKKQNDQRQQNQGQQNQQKNQQGQQNRQGGQEVGQDESLNPQGNRDIRQAPASPNANKEREDQKQNTPPSDNNRLNADSRDRTQREAN